MAAQQPAGRRAGTFWTSTGALDALADDNPGSRAVARELDQRALFPLPDLVALLTKLRFQGPALYVLHKAFANLEIGETAHILEALREDPAVSYPLARGGAWQPVGAYCRPPSR
jgi:hypothetical protein